jgi:hypothetical protein
VTDGAFTEVEGPGLTDNAEIVIDETDAGGAAGGPGAPRSQQRGPRMF